MQAKKPYISTGLRHIFAIVSSQISTMMEPSNAFSWDKFPIQSFDYPWLFQYCYAVLRSKS